MQATISTLLKQFFCGILVILIEEKEAASSTQALGVFYLLPRWIQPAGIPF